MVKVIILCLIFGGGILALQVLLSKNEKKWPGLILPILTFVLSIVLVVLAFQLESNDGRDVTSDAFGTEMALVFMVINIATLIFMFIYFIFQKRNNKRLVEKMSIKDL